LVKLRSNCVNHEVTKSIAISGNSDKIYSLSEKGLFQVWNLNTLERIYCKHFRKKTLSVMVCKKSHLIILVFDMEIIMLDSNRPDYKKLEQKF
jgi:hypothetical protein